jgi:hypothetical protein
MTFSGYFIGFSCAACSFDSEMFVFKFLCGDHGYMPCAPLCLILTPQTPNLASDSKISGGSLALFLSLVRDQFLVI